jgi:phosphomannomutase
MKLDELLIRARTWADEDPDPRTRDELIRLIGAAEQGSVPEVTALRDQFLAPLAFGTAGLRGQMGPGPNRMNRSVVIRATAGLAAYLADQGLAGEPVVVGHDARHNSAAFAADTAAVLAAAGHPVWSVDRPVPTPVVAYGVRRLGCCAGVQVTASHNPRQDNGYKVYLGDGAQIVPPADSGIAAHIAAVGPLASVPRAAAADPLITAVGDELIADYRRDVVGLAVAPAERELAVAYTPLHGVAADVVTDVFAQAGFAPLHVVEAQVRPDPDFPTVVFPNPEEPGALDMALALADEVGADVVIANDPDGDRLAVAVPSPTAASAATAAATAATSGWRVLSGDEIGVLLADWLLEHGSGPDRLVATTIVSSSMLGRLAAARGVRSAETLTGFKWIVRPALAQPELEFVFGYEEALGSCVGSLVRDKDGISAALSFAELVATERRRGRSVLDRLDDLSRELGVHATAQLTIPLAGSGASAAATAGAAAVDRLVGAPPSKLAGIAVSEVVDLRRGERLPPTDGVILRGEGVRLIVRPSGTEPKLKCYAEAVVSPAEATADLAAARSTARARTAAVLDEVVGLLEA